MISNFISAGIPDELGDFSDGEIIRLWKRHSDIAERTKPLGAPGSPEHQLWITEVNGAEECLIELVTELKKRGIYNLRGQ